MARYEHLPIYKQALEAAVHSEKVVADFAVQRASRCSSAVVAFVP